MDSLKTLEAVGNNFYVAPVQKKLACRGSSKSETVCFKLDRYAGKTDLSECHCTIKTKNSEGKSDVAIPEVTADDKKLTINWVPSSGTTVAAGPLQVQVQLEKIFDDSSQNINWQSSIMEFEIMDSLDAADEIEDQEPTIFQQWEEKVNTLYANANADVQAVQVLQTQVQADAGTVGQQKQSVEQMVAQVTQDVQVAAENVQDAAAQAQQKVNDFSGYTKEEIDNGFACALIGKKAGQSILLDDIQQNTNFSSLLVTGGIVQNGSGDVSPDNVRAISGTTALTVEDNNDNIQMINLPQMLYNLPGGNSDDYDAISGVVTQRIGKIVLSGNEGFTLNRPANSQTYNFQIKSSFPNGVTTGISVISSHYPFLNQTWDQDISAPCCYVYLNELTIKYPKDEQTNTTVAAFKAFLAAQNAAGTPVTILYLLASPLSINGQISSVKPFPGINKLTVNAGAISATYCRDSNAVLEKIFGIIGTI